MQAIASGCNVSNITFVRVIEPLHLHGGLESCFSPAERKRPEEDSLNIAREYLGKLTKQLEDNGIAVKSEVLYGKVIDRLAEYADANGVDLIIMATHGRSRDKPMGYWKRLGSNYPFRQGTCLAGACSRL